MAVLRGQLVGHVDAAQVVGVDWEPGRDPGIGEAGVITGVPLDGSALGIAGAALVVVAVGPAIAA